MSSDSKRIVIKLLRVTSLDDPKVLTVQAGEQFFVENATTTDLYFKRASDGVLVKLPAAVDGGSY
jgi:hypothetical protein